MKENDSNSNDHYQTIADFILGETEALPDVPDAPHPADGGYPEHWVDSEYVPDIYDLELTPQDLNSEEMRRVDPLVIEKCAAEPQNDYGNGQRLLHHFSKELLYVREVGWHRFVGTHWESLGGAEKASECAHRTAERIALEADYLTATPSEISAMTRGEEVAAELRTLKRRPFKEWSHAEKSKADELNDLIAASKVAIEALRKRQVTRRKFAVSSGNAMRIRAMLETAMPYCSAVPEALDADPLAFNVRNGTIRFAKKPDPDAGRDAARDKWTVELHPHTPGDLISKCAPVDYDGNAGRPNFDAFIHRFQPQEAVRKFLQTYLGYALTGLTGEQCLIFNIGVGSNGKSTLLEVVSRVMGPYAQSLQFASLAEIGFGRRGDQATPDIARLPGARLVRASEPPKDARFDEALIKSMTGGEPMLVRNLNKGFFELHPVFKLVLSGNHRPTISGVDHGIWRRMRIVPWPVKLEDHEKRPQDDILRELMADASGILNWLIEGALDYLNNGLNAPPEVKDATEDYREEMDPIGGFLRDCVTILPPTSDGTEPERVTAREMYEAFRAWCIVNSVRPWKEKSFAQAMMQKGFVKDRSKTVRRYINVRLHDVPEVPSRNLSEPPLGDDDVAPL